MLTSLPPVNPVIPQFSPNFQHFAVVEKELLQSQTPDVSFSATARSKKLFMSNFQFMAGYALKIMIQLLQPQLAC